jgi:hypothetical protein
LKNVLSASFIREFLPRLQESVLRTLLGFSVADIRREDKVSFYEVGGYLYDLLGLVMEESKIEELFENFNLDVALKSFLSNSLERRLRGIKYMRRMVARTEIKEEKSFGLSNLWKVKEEKEKDKEFEDKKPMDPKYDTVTTTTTKKTLALLSVPF